MFSPVEVIEISSDSESDTDISNFTISDNSLEDHRMAFNCQKCSEKFFYRAMLDRHMWTHKNETAEEDKSSKRLLQCDYCDKVLKSQVMQRHVKQVHNHECFYCAKCQKFWITLTTFTQHMRLKHNEDFLRLKKKHYECEQCGDVFDSHSGLIGHRRTHNAKVTYFCDFCMRKFHVKPHLRSHVQIHIKSKPFGCHLCKSSFRRRDYLNKHLKRHETNNYACRSCGKVMPTKRAYKKHRQLHRGGRKALFIDYTVD